MDRDFENENIESLSVKNLLEKIQKAKGIAGSELKTTKIGEA